MSGPWESYQGGKAASGATPGLQAVGDKRIFAYCAAALDNQTRELASLSEGSRNQGLNDAALKLGHLEHHGVFGVTEAMAALQSACEENGLIGQDGQAAFEATFRSGWLKGSSEPHDILERPEPEARPIGGPKLAVVGGNDSVEQTAAIAKLRPQPLSRTVSEAEDFPTDALPPMLADIVAGIVDKISVPAAVAAQSVLAVSALAAQPFHDVELPTGQRAPMSLYFVSVLESGGRKTAADNEATAGIRRREAFLRGEYDLALEEYEHEVEAFKAARADVLRDRAYKGNRAGKRAALAALGREPERPLLPSLTFPDPTLEGLAKVLPDAHASLAIMNSEGGSMVGGYGFSEDNQLKTAAGLSLFWDGAPVKRIRAGAEPLIAVGRRLSISLQVQPGVADTFFGSEILRDQGLLSRILAVAPVSNVGSRLWHDAAPESQQAIDAFARRIDHMLAQRLPLAEGKRNELQPPALRLSMEARKLWIDFADFAEAEMRPGGSFETIRHFANKAPEQAARLAAVMTTVCEHGPREITGEMMTRALALVEHYAAEAVRMLEVSRVAPDIAIAQAVIDWLLSVWPHDVVSLPDVYQRGPSRAVRDKASAARIIAILEDHQHLFRLSRGAVVGGSARRDAWLIVGKRPQSKDAGQ